MEASQNDVNNVEPAKAVVEIYKQLTNGFQPATKAVAECGTNLLRTFQSLQKHCDAYLKALETLARSGEKAYSEGKKKAAELELLVGTMKGICGKHGENISSFSQLITRINDNSREEKEKLRDMSHSYETREKAIKKAVHKGQQDQDDLQSFYQREMEAALKQQSQRYKFAVEKHTEWISGYVDLMQFATALFADHLKRIGLQETAENKQHSSKLEKPKKKTSEENEDNSVLENVSAVSNTPSENGDDADSLKPTASRSENDPHHRLSARQPVESKLRDAVTSYKEDLKNLLFESDADSVIDNFILKKSPVSKPEMEPKRKHSVSTTTDNLEQNDRDTASSLLHTQNRRSNTDNYSANDVRYPESSESPQRKSAAESRTDPDFKVPFEDRPKHPVPPARASHYTEKPPIAAKIDERRPLSQPNGVMYRPKMTNAIPTAIIPPAFGNADNGRTLSCIHEFRGQTANQLSLKVGDRIILIKSGSKGWIFAKHTETQETGWFPSRFVELLPDDPGEKRL